MPFSSSHATLISTVFFWVLPAAVANGVREGLEEGHLDVELVAGGASHLSYDLNDLVHHRLDRLDPRRKGSAEAQY